jgi:hypothetical protein
MPDLRTTIAHLAQSFAESVLAAIRTTSLDALLADSRGAAPRTGPRRHHRGHLADSPKTAPAPPPISHNAGGPSGRSPEDIAKALDLIVKFLKTRPEGLRSEEIRKTFGLDVREVPRVLKEGLARKKLKSRGRKRATTYSTV